MAAPSRLAGSKTGTKKARSRTRLPSAAGVFEARAPRHGRVGEIPLELSPKLLGALPEREFEVAAVPARSVPTDGLIAATNRALEEMVDEQKFRSDSYDRLMCFRCDSASSSGEPRCDILPLGQLFRAAVQPPVAAEYRNHSVRDHRGAGSLFMAGQHSRTPKTGLSARWWRRWDPC